MDSRIHCQHYSPSVHSELPSQLRGRDRIPSRAGLCSCDLGSSEHSQALSVGPAAGKSAWLQWLLHRGTVKKTASQLTDRAAGRSQPGHTAFPRLSAPGGHARVALVLRKVPWSMHFWLQHELSCAHPHRQRQAPLGIAPWGSAILSQVGEGIGWDTRRGRGRPDWLGPSSPTEEAAETP